MDLWIGRTRMPFEAPPSIGSPRPIDVVYPDFSPTPSLANVWLAFPLPSSSFARQYGNVARGCESGLAKIRAGFPFLPVQLP